MPQIWACPCAQMLADEAGTAPGALGATAHGAVSQSMCKYIGGYTDLVKELGLITKTAKELGLVK